MKHTGKRTGFTLTETLIVGALFGTVIIAGTLLLSVERARTRDAKRVADMVRLAAGFSLLYSQKASYADAATGCPAVNANPNTCTLGDVVSGLGQIHDPGRFAYIVTQVPNKDDFGITFQLERNYGALFAGKHVLSKSGIR
ncbi:MAG: hypothetical protein HY975_00595 [Candidatus Kerfeldbacteria bacterium]|nr:hypothetical protein [Candidatus Kerfeldbacteria bacterium]